MRPQRHANADLARATGDGVGFDAVNPDDREEQRNPAEDAEHDRAQTDDPKSDVLLDDVGERLYPQYREVGIDVAQRLAERWEQRGHAGAVRGVRADVEVDRAAVSLRERDVEPL